MSNSFVVSMTAFVMLVSAQSTLMSQTSGPHDDLRLPFAPHHQRPNAFDRRSLDVHRDQADKVESPRRTQSIPLPRPAQSGRDSRLKATPDSVQVDWIRHYTSGLVPAFDAAYAIAVDAFGNVYVTGSSYGPDTLSDYATIKYDASGVKQWVARYNGPGDDWDAAASLAVDASGNVYVTGRTYSSGSFFDYATIKYNALGVQQWVALYDGPGNSDDVATGLAIDDSGSVYVTGYSIGVGTFYDYATIKYNALGVQQWVARYNGPGNTSDRAYALAVDGSGSVYVTGASGEGSINLSDYVTVKYGASGVEQWAARYSSWYDYATAVAVDASGNVYVTGYSYDLGTYYDYATVKYTTSGVQQWVARYNGPGSSDDFAYALSLDATGNVYVTGESVGPGTEADYATVKYDTLGVQQWVARYNGLGNAVDRAVDLALDASGNVYVTGESEGSGTVTDYATVKYNPSGIQDWVARYNGPGNSFDHATALAVGTSGNVYVTGRSTDVGWSVYTTIKYVQVPVTVQEEDAGVPGAFTLEQNYPNPFNPSTSIAYDVATTTYTRLAVFDLLGREVVVLVDAIRQPGRYLVKFSAMDFASGVYIYRIEAGTFKESKKLLLLR